MELKEWWDIEYSVIPEESVKYYKKVKIIIKNHSPFLRKFRIGLEKIDVKNELNYLRLKMFLDISTPVLIEVEKYRKKEIEFTIPRLALPEKDGKIIVFVENVDKKEKKSIEIFL